MTSPQKKRKRVLFVCLGNICRSPLAEGVLNHKLAQERIDSLFEVDSAGTGAWHIGEQADQRMRETASNYGVSLDMIRARQFMVGDFDEFDVIYAMDRQNREDILSLARSHSDKEKVRLFRSQDPEPEDMDVPDPYFGGSSGFDKVYNIVERTVENMLSEWMSES